MTTAEQANGDGGGGPAAVVAALRAGDDALALERCTALLAQKPDDGAIAPLAAVAAFRLGRHAQARALAGRALAIRPDHGPTWLLLGRAARALGEDSDAVNAFGQAAHLMPDRAEPAFLFCAMLLRAGHAEAQARLADLQARFPRHAAGWDEIGAVLAQAGRREAALVCVSRAMAADPNPVRAMRQGTLMRELGRLTEAVAAFEAAVQLDGASARGWFLLGLCRQDAGHHMAAAEAYRAALACDPALAEAAVNLGTVLQEARDLEGAKAAYGAAVRTRSATFGRVAQAMTTSPRGELWLDLGKLRRHLAG